VLLAKVVSSFRELPGGLSLNNDRNPNRQPDLRVPNVGAFLLAADGRTHLLAADGRATLVADGPHKLVFAVSFRGGVLSLFVDGRVYYTDDPATGLTRWLVRSGVVVPAMPFSPTTYVTLDTSPVGGALSP